MSYNPTDFFVKKATNNDVKIEHDPSVITRKSERKTMNGKDIAEYQREASRGGQIGSKQANMGLASSMSKSDRQVHLLAGIKRGTYKSIPQICMSLNIAESTAKKYLRELNIAFDPKSGEIKKS
jgi:DNA-binding CsgD family transcriptional regulator